MAVMGESVAPFSGYSISELAGRVRAYLTRPISKEDFFEKTETQFTAEEIFLLRRLGALELAEPIARIYEQDEDETHIWRDRQGTVKVHFKRPDDFEEKTRHTRIAIRFNQAGEPSVVHIRSALSDISLKGAQVIRLEVGRSPLLEPVLEEFDELGMRLRKIEDEGAEQLAA